MTKTKVRQFSSARASHTAYKKYQRLLATARANNASDLVIDVLLNKIKRNRDQYRELTKKFMGVS